MTLKEAINARVSRRSFTSTPLSSEAIAALHKIIDQANVEDGLNLQLITNEPKAFKSFLKTYGLFSGVHSYIALVGPANGTRIQQLIGYYGELLVLTAQTLDLGTCWVGASYDKNNCKAVVNEGEQLYCLIAVGYPSDKTTLSQRFVQSKISKTTHSSDEITTVKGNYPAPAWFNQGIDAVLVAPSAINKLPVHFTYENGIVTAETTEKTGYENIDLGIAKLHFEIGADYIFYDLRSKH